MVATIKKTSNIDRCVTVLGGEWGMDLQKIAVIIYNNNGIGYDKEIEYLSQLNVPAGMKVDIITLDDSVNRFVMYNQSMMQSDAKYKIYMDDRSIILNPDFFAEVIELFKEEKVGAIGVWGTSQLSTTGDFAITNSLTGKIVFDNGDNFDGKEIIDKYFTAQILGQGIFVTQYDVRWRNDIFSSNIYWTESQSLEFRRLGFKCIVPRQIEPWLLLHDGYQKTDEQSKNIFLDEYSKDIYPLVSVVIPTYNRPHYLQEALDSVLQQTYRNLDIFITDDSDNDETEKLIHNNYVDERISYEFHPDYDVKMNWDRLVEYNNPQAQYVKYLMDDDLLMPNSIAVMMEVFLTNNDVTLVTSYRKLIDRDGKEMPDEEFSKKFVEKTSKMEGISVGDYMLCNMSNFIGETSTTLIKKDKLFGGTILGKFKNNHYRYADFTTWLDLMTKGDLVYVVEPLSCFRLHAGQSTFDFFNAINVRICWAMMIMDAIQSKTFLREKFKQRKAILRLCSTTQWFLDRLDDKQWEDRDIKNLLKIYSRLAEALGEPEKFKFIVKGRNVEI